MIINIDVVSDFVCPWCFLGKERLAAAIAQFSAERPQHPVRVNWLPYFLNPGTPTSGEPYRAFLEAKFGGARRVNEIHAQLQKAGEADGVAFAFERIRLRPNTLHAQRLVYRAQARGEGPERIQTLVDALFAAYFLHGRDIGDIESLADLSGEQGERREQLIAYLEGNEDVPAVKRMAAQVSKQGVDGVPFFIMNRQMGVSGAQSPAVLGAALLQAAGVTSRA